MVYKFFDKKTKGSEVKSTSQNEQLADELHKPIIRKFKKRKIYSAFKDNIWDANLYAWVVPLKDKKGVSIVNAFQSILKKSNRKPNKIKVF